MPKLPLPPVPKTLMPRPKRPGQTEEVPRTHQLKEAGISAVDWIETPTCE